MGTDYTAHAVIGVRLEREEVIKDVVMPTCRHDVSESFKFCPECGNPRESIEERLVDGLAPIEFYETYTSHEALRSFRDFPIIWSSNIQAQFCVIGFVVDSAYGRAPGITGLHGYKNLDLLVERGGILSIKEELKSALETVDLWREERFGLHAMISASG